MRALNLKQSHFFTEKPWLLNCFVPCKNSNSNVFFSSKSRMSIGFGIGIHTKVVFLQVLTLNFPKVFSIKFSVTVAGNRQKIELEESKNNRSQLAYQSANSTNPTNIATSGQSSAWNETMEQLSQSIGLSPFRCVYSIF